MRFFWPKNVSILSVEGMVVRHKKKIDEDFRLIECNYRKLKVLEKPLKTFSEDQNCY